MRSLAAVKPSSQGCGQILNDVEESKIRSFNLIIAHSALSGCESSVIDAFFEEIRSKKDLEANLRKRLRKWERERRD